MLELLIKLLSAFRVISCNHVCKISQPFVTYLIYTSQHSDVTHSGQWTATSLDVNVFLYIVALFFGDVI